MTSYRQLNKSKGMLLLQLQLLLVVASLLSVAIVPSTFPICVDAVSTNEHNHRHRSVGTSSSSTSSSLTRANTAVVPPPPTTYSKKPSIRQNITNEITTSISTNSTTTVAAAAIVTNPLSIRNDNGTETFYVTAEETNSEERQSSLFYTIDSYIQEKLVLPIVKRQPLLSPRQQQQHSYHVFAVVVGVMTAALGFGYVSVLALCRNLLWTALPRALFHAADGKVSSIPSFLFITGMTTLAGLLLGYVTTHQSSDTPVYTASDFVSKLSAYENGKMEPSPLLPSSKDHLFPLLGMCLLTSSFGIPLGPEAPMVGAGTLIGASVAKYLSSLTDYGDGTQQELEQVLAYAGASGALTGAMGIPIVGAIFALEMVQSNAGMSPATHKALSPSIVASLVAIAILKLICKPSSFVGGHFDYLAYGNGGGNSMLMLNHAITGRAMILTAVASGLGGSLLGTAFHTMYVLLKERLWQPKKVDRNGTVSKRRKIVVRACVGLMIGLIGISYPQSLFWGEGSLQSYVDGQRTPFAQTNHGLPNFLYQSARVDPSQPYGSPWEALQVGVAKFVAILLAGAGKFSGGIVFPLFAAAPAFAHVVSPYLARAGHHRLVPLAVMCTMAATQASATRTPLASALILALTASSTTELSVILPACLIASYLSIFASKWMSKKSYFHYHEENDILQL